MPQPDSYQAHAHRLQRRAVALLAAGMCLSAPGSTGFAAPDPGSPSAAASQASYVPGRLFLKLRAPAGPPRKAGPALRAALGAALATAQPLLHGRHTGPVAAGVDRLFSVRLAPDTDVPLLAAKLSRLAEVEYAEPAWTYELASAGGGPVPLAVPNDPSYTGGQQVYLAKLQVESAWDVQKSEAGSPRPIVCIVDGGTNWQHEDLLGNVWTNPGEIAANGIDDDGNGYIDDIHGWNFRDNNGNPRGSTATPGNANHGTHTGGLAAAVTNNAVGVAGASWNPLLMSVNASSTNDGGIAYGYDGIVYAAENGADVISLSWGSQGGSQTLQDVIDFAIAQGSLVVAAAGNNNSRIPFFPAAYTGVIAVANVTNDDVRYGGASASNYGGWLDVAAPGTSLYSTTDFGTTNSYGFSTGTSMACPVAAAVAALIKAQHPTWPPLKVGEQLRISCDNINSVNPGFEDLLGKGRVNALRAVTLSSPAVRVTSATFQDADANGELNQGENVVMGFVVHNYQQPALGPSFTLSSGSPYVTITDGTQSSADILEDAEATFTSAFAFTVSPNAPPGASIDLRVDMTATDYTDFQFIPIVLEPAFKTHDINNVTVSITGTGGIGFVGFSDGFGTDGQGFHFQGGPNVLYEGALLLGIGSTKLSDAARAGGERSDFAPVLHDPPRKSTPGAQQDQEIHGAFTDSINTTTPLGVRVTLSSWAHAAAPYDDFVILEYDVWNRSVARFDSLWAALFFDWDIDENHYDTNRADYDASRRLGYAWDATPGLPYVGVMALSGATAAYSAIPNGGPGPVVLYNGFSKAEKWDILQGGTGVLSAGPTDISNALSSGPYRVPFAGDVPVFFALLGGSSLADLQANADRALQFFTDSLTTDVPGEVPGVRAPFVAIGPPVPNPFNPSTRFELEVRDARDVSVAIFDARGRRVATLTEGPRTPGRYSLTWNGRDTHGRRVASGTYFARLRAGGVQQVRQVVLAK